MLLITCPWCGPRAQIEFTYGGDASVTRPADPDGVSAEAWLDHVYLRDNPRGPHDEWWQHTSGCRSWIKVRRDTWTHRMIGSGPPGAGGAGDGNGPSGAVAGEDGNGSLDPGGDGGRPIGIGSGEGQAGLSGAGEDGSEPPGSGGAGTGSSGPPGAGPDEGGAR